MKKLPPICNLEEIDPTAHAASGDFEPLAKYIEEGGALGSHARELLASILRGKRFKPGNRRTYAQQMAEWDAQEAVRSLQRHYAILHGSRGSRARAIRRYLELHPKIKEGTLRDYLKRSGGTLSKAELQFLDKVRDEALAKINRVGKPT